MFSLYYGFLQFEQFQFQLVYCRAVFKWRSIFGKLHSVWHVFDWIHLNLSEYIRKRASRINWIFFFHYFSLITTFVWFVQLKLNNLLVINYIFFILYQITDFLCVVCLIVFILNVQNLVCKICLQSNNKNKYRKMLNIEQTSDKKQYCECKYAYCMNYEWDDANRLASMNTIPNAT